MPWEKIKQQDLFSGRPTQTLIRIDLKNMRHSAATSMLEAGIDINVIQKILGHSDLSTTQIYANVMDNYMIKEMQKFK